MDDDKVIDMSNVIDPEQMPLCPLCDQPIGDYEPAGLILAHGYKGLAHVICIAENRDDD